MADGFFGEVLGAAQSIAGDVAGVFTAKTNAQTAQAASQALAQQQTSNLRLIVIGLVGIAGIYFLIRETT